MTRLLEKRSAIYSICALWIVLFHVRRLVGMPYIPVVTNVIGLGNMAVDVFLFFSGLCLSLSVPKHQYLEKGWKEYYKRRFTRILIPYAIICIPYYIWNCLHEYTGSLTRRAFIFAANISSATFWLRGMQTTWFVYAIIVMYLLFPHIYRAPEKARNKKRTRAVILAVMIAFAIAAFYLPVLNNSIVVWARLPIFTIGVFLGQEKDKEYTFSKGMIAAAAVMFICLGAWISQYEIFRSFQLPQVYRLLLYIPMTLALLILFQAVRGRMSLLAPLGSLTLEIYLIHITLTHPIRYYGLLPKLNYWLYLVLPVVSVILSYIVKRIEDLVIKRIEGRK